MTDWMVMVLTLSSKVNNWCLVGIVDVHLLKLSLPSYLLSTLLKFILRNAPWLSGDGVSSRVMLVLEVPCLFP